MGGVAVVQGEVRGVLGTWVNKLPEFIWFGFSDAIVVILKDYCDTVHFRLRSFKGVRFRFANFAFHFKGKCHFHFLIHGVLL